MSVSVYGYVLGDMCVCEYLSNVCNECMAYVYELLCAFIHDMCFGEFT